MAESSKKAKATSPEKDIIPNPVWNNLNERPIIPAVML